MNPKRLLLIATLFAAQGTALAASSPSKPNIVFIYADDWGWGDLSCHGNSWLQTPNIDRLAREGTDFQQFNVLNPVCSASRVALMTGQNPARWSVHQHFATPALNRKMEQVDWLDPEAPTLARFLKQAGYNTAHFGKWHLTNAQTEAAPLPEAYGYDQAKVFNGGAGWPNENTHATAANTAAFIKENKDAPFFINVWIHESHTPHMPTKESMEKWKHLDERKQIYAAVITDGDNSVGTILDSLDTEGLADNTIFWEWRGFHEGTELWPNLAVRDGIWKLAIAADGTQVELHNLAEDRAEAVNVAKDYPEVVERLTKLVHDWKNTLPTKPNPACISQSRSSAPEASVPKKKTSNSVEPEVRAKAFARWDKDEDRFLTLDEFKAGLEGQENLEQRFMGFDQNGDGKLTREEFVGPSTK